MSFKITEIAPPQEDEEKLIQERIDRAIESLETSDRNAEYVTKIIDKEQM